MPTDFLSVLQGFNDAGVRYVLVGGLAVLFKACGPVGSGNPVC
jgi:hypothetical protein